MLKPSIIRLDPVVARRGAAINELYFTYRHLLRLLPAFAKRVPEPLSGILMAQHAEDDDILRKLEDMAREHGQPPVPSLCESASDLLDRLYHADRSRPVMSVRVQRITVALRTVRAYLVREWCLLSDSLQDEFHAGFLSLAQAILQRETERHKDLTELTERLQNSGGEREMTPLRAV